MNDRAAGAVERCARVDLDPVLEVCRTCGVPAWRTKRGWVHEWREARLPEAVATGGSSAGAAPEGYSTRP